MNHCHFKQYTYLGFILMSKKLYRQKMHKLLRLRRNVIERDRTFHVEVA